MRKLILLVFSVLFVETAAFAVDGEELIPALTPGFPPVAPVIDDSHWGDTQSLFGVSSKGNDLAEMMRFQTPVKNQAGRGTCSIFSTLGALESLLLRQEGVALDLSENYLEYLVMARTKTEPSEGSTPDVNGEAISSFGMIEERVWPYEGYDWTSQLIPPSETKKAQEVCGKQAGKALMRCLLGHMPADQDAYKSQAADFRAKHALWGLSIVPVSMLAEIQYELDQQNPVILSIRFFYGAWNHPMMETYGIGVRNMGAFERGVVGVPTAGDIAISTEHPSGHSVVVIGYNEDEKVYYFKNGWGTDRFGAKAELPGYGPAPGYGSIPYEYAHQHGMFYRVSRR